MGWGAASDLFPAHLIIEPALLLVGVSPVVFEKKNIQSRKELQVGTFRFLNFRSGATASRLPPQTFFPGRPAAPSQQLPGSIVRQKLQMQSLQSFRTLCFPARQHLQHHALPSGLQPPTPRLHPTRHLATGMGVYENSI